MSLRGPAPADRRTCSPVTAAQLAGRRSAAPGGGRRLTAVTATLVIAGIAAALLLGTADAWRHTGHGHARALPAAAQVEEPPLEGL
jgi:hypothetical protein